MPIGLYTFKLISILCATIATIGKDKAFLAVKKVAGLVEVMLIRGSGGETVRQAGYGINTDMDFHAEVPFISLLSLVHLRIALSSFICVTHRDRFNLADSKSNL